MSPSVPPAHATASPAAVMEPGAGGLTMVPALSDPPWVEDRAVEGPAWPLAKRAFDIAVSFGVLLLASPFLILVAIAVKLDSPGPIFYRVRRVGHRGRPLMMLKFRKMRDDATGGPLTTGGDPRLTRVGAVLTRTRLDELPQLWDVLRGRMSIVGPRPEDPGFVALHPEDYAQILLVRPGISGLSQLAYAGESHILNDEDPVEDYIGRILPQKLRMDRLYARRSTVRLDLKILFWTVMTVLLRRPVAVHRTTARMNIRRRPTVEPEAAGHATSGHSAAMLGANVAPAERALSGESRGDDERLGAPTSAPAPARRSVA